MTTMRERLIAAIDREANRYIREAGDYVGLADVPYELFVDAVLDELEQPSEGMAQSGYEADRIGLNARGIWARMIAAAKENK